jgi:dephospho-CoA kinase
VSKWAGKYVIGLTGNIGTGKSVVRRMLEHQGAYGIDADALGHRAIAKGAPGYQPVIDMFGRWLVGPDGEINRNRLGKVVFSDKDALAILENIVPPLVLRAVDWTIQRATQPVIVIEAIKLLESNLRSTCDSVWVVIAPPEVQLARLVQKRGMTEAEARQRIAAQPPQDQKVSAANVVVHNANAFEDTWKQVMGAWQKFVPASFDAAPATPARSVTKLPQGELVVTRGRPRDCEAIAGLINRVKKTGQPVSKNDIMAEFGEKAFLIVRIGEQLIAASGWQVENLVARTTGIVIDPAVPAAQVLPAMMNEMERASRDLQCEASLVFTAPEYTNDAVWQELGYERRTPQALGVAVWTEAAQETLKPGMTMFFKQLREDRVLRPI